MLPIISRVSTLATNPATGLAQTQQSGVSPQNKDSKTDSTPKLVFWNGVVNGVPRATGAHGVRSLVWNGPNNLIE